MQEEPKVINLNLSNEKPVINKETRMDKQVNIYKLFLHVIGEPEEYGVMCAFGYERSKLIEYYNSCLAPLPYTDKDGVSRYFKEDTDLYVMTPLQDSNKELFPNQYKHGINNQWVSEDVVDKAVESLIKHYRLII